MTHLSSWDYARVIETGVEKINSEIDKEKEWFDVLIQNGVDEYDWYEFARVVFERAFGEELDFSVFDTGWQWRNVNNPLSGKSQREELVNLLLGWW